MKPGDGFATLEATPETLFDTLGRMFTGNGQGTGTGNGRRLQIALTFAACLFMLLPAVNLINLNTSRIMERASEIGVRKAFGASSRTLVGQFVVENLVLTLVGALIALLVAALVLQAINGSGMIQAAQLHLNYRIFGWGSGWPSVWPPFRRLPGLEDVPAAPVIALKGVAMIRHVFEFIWNSRRTNLLMMIEISCSFLVLFAVVALGVYTADNWRRPLGFSIDRVWTIAVDMKQTTDDTFTPAQQESTRQLMLALAEFPEIEKSAGTMLAPYQFGSSNSRYTWHGRSIGFGVSEVTDGFKDLLGLDVVEGRWFNAEDEGQHVRAGRHQPGHASGFVRPGPGHRPEHRRRPHSG